jgi:hypothetical protein
MKNARILSRPLTALLASAAFGLVFAASNSASAQIKQPGAHPRYSVELDPHLVLAWDGPFNNHFDDEGIGLGLRATIPIIEQGPIKKINNSLGIGFGGDFIFYGDGHCRYGRWDYQDDCSGTSLFLPVVAQWNFWLTPSISVFGEPGLAIRYSSLHREYPCGNEFCDDDDTDLDFIPFVLWGGGRFLVGDSVGITVRLGWPYLGVGVGFLI